MKSFLIIKLNILLLLVAFSPSLLGQVTENTEAQIDQVFKEWNEPGVPGGAVGIVKDGRLIFSKAYGIADLEHNIALRPSSVFYLASISKQFVAFSILLLEEQGKLNLDDPIQKILPDFPTYNSPVTIRHLIHHTSGIRDCYTLLFLKGQDYLDHPHEDEIYRLIKGQKQLNFKPGAKYLYSNSCYFLLAKIVEKISKMPMREFADESIFKPLGMNSTLFYDDVTGLIKDRVFSYQNQGGKFYNQTMRFDLVGSGGIYSTIEDLFLWDQNFYKNRLGKGNQQIIKQLMEDGTLNDGKSAGYAFGLQNGTYKGLQTVGHSGAMAGFRTQYLRFPEQNFSIIILSNRSDTNETFKSYELADIFLKNKFRTDLVSNVKSSEPKVTVRKMSSSELRKFRGAYWNEENAYVRVIYEQNGKLIYSRSTNNESVLTPIGSSEFKIMGIPIDFRVRFELGDENNKMIVTIDDQDPVESVSFTQVSYTEDDLKALAGSYYSKELGAHYNLIFKEDRLILELNGKEISNVVSITPNAFSCDLGVLVFKESNGKLGKEFELMVDRVKKLRFKKL